MLLAVSVLVAVLLLAVLFQKFIGGDRGVDKHVERAEGVVIGKEPYVPPSVDKEIREEMSTLQQMMIPVQYVDNGLLPKITNKLEKVERALRPDEYRGPAAFSDTDPSTSPFQEAKFSDALKDFEPDVLPRAGSLDVEPFNSFLGMVVSEGQTVSPLDS